METSKTRMRFAAVFAAVLVAVALSFGVTTVSHGEAYAADSESSINVTVISGSSTQQAVVSYDDLQDYLVTDNYGYLYCKGGVWNVVGTNNSVEIGDLFDAAGFGSAWVNAADSAVLSFTCSDGAYTKYFPTKGEVEANNTFYGATTESATSLASTAYAPAVIAFNTNHGILSGTTTASQLLPSVVSGTTDTAPRFCMGLNEDTYNADDAMGKRMPSEVTGITLTL